MKSSGVGGGSFCLPRLYRSIVVEQVRLLVLSQLFLVCFNIEDLSARALRVTVLQLVFIWISAIDAVQNIRQAWINPYENHVSEFIALL